MSILSLMFLFIHAGAVGSESYTQAKCAKMSDSRMQAVASIDSIEKIKDVWARHGSCIDGASAETYAESVSQLLDTQWDKVMSSEMLKDPQTIEALTRGVSETWEFSLSQRVLKMAEKRCSRNAKEVCQKIIRLVPIEKSDQK